MGTHRVYREHKFAFGQQLLTLRTRVALTQIELAKQLGVHRRSVQNWETGESYPKAEMLQRLIAVFVRQRAFTAAQEREEAHVLWRLAAEDGPHPLPPMYIKQKVKKAPVASWRCETTRQSQELPYDNNTTSV
jgi:transcriptional regulator with XRE-family HTH domain